MEFTLETKKTKDEVIQILMQNTSNQKGGFFRNYDAFFSGTISEDTFKILRNISYRNSFLHVIIGKIEQNNDICKVHIKTRMTIFVIVSIWFTGVILGCLITPFVGFPMPYTLIPYIMLIVGSLIVLLPKE